jgi:hypothetical protein
MAITKMYAGSMFLAFLPGAKTPRKAADFFAKNKAPCTAAPLYIQGDL